eukprot:CAMPEP_0202445660 /NCGR_PEP_ID=MMETSP1360-20130828/4428_1 /ASSEMBLY_ACC=CAM_ASM_000848 /TAXON_ID=515479 /ORGANISM="Licmophora paradoxa, Strain CCMP2313" /LENGTH=132 /DNA_ID=CAMNT_0049061995 /DNA_START=82 /DNA_END=480 /DNA_ORIENTATION=+
MITNTPSNDNNVAYVVQSLEQLNLNNQPATNNSPSKQIAQSPNGGQYHQQNYAQHHWAQNSYRQVQYDSSSSDLMECDLSDRTDDRWCMSSFEDTAVAAAAAAEQNQFFNNTPSYSSNSVDSKQYWEWNTGK